MTLIAAISVDDWPILLGDLLLVSEIAPSGRLALPTVGELPDNLELSGAYRVTGSAQKVCIINSRLVVACAGRLVYAREIIRKMKKFFARNSPDKRSLERFFKSQHSKYMKEMQFICLYFSNDRLWVFVANAVKIETETFGDCYIGGTGAGEFIEMLYGEVGQGFVGARELATLSGPQKAICVGLMFTGHMLAKEIADGANFSSYYGGGMEIATYQNDTFKKVDEVLHLFWRYDEEKYDRLFRLIPILYRINYKQERLLVRRIQFQLSGDKSNLSSKGDFFTVDPVYGRAKGTEINVDDLVNWDGKYFVNHVFGEGPKDNKWAMIHLGYSKDGNGLFKVVVTDRGISLLFSSSFYEEMRRGIEKILS
jgi:hypothetical protein